MEIMDYSQPPSNEPNLNKRDDNSSKPKKPNLKIITTLLVLFMTIVVVVIFSQQDSKPVAKVAVTKTSIVKPAEANLDDSIKRYVSNGIELNLEFDYPSSWAISPASNNNTNDQTITIDSPLTTISSADGKLVTGKISVRIRSTNVGITELSSGISAAALDSVQIAYTKPTAQQFQYPFLNFIHLPGGANPTSAFEEVLITGNNKFTKDQIVSDANIAVNPIITANIYSCSTSACTGTGATALGINFSTWTNDSIFKQTLNIFKSLQLN